MCIARLRIWKKKTYIKYPDFVGFIQSLLIKLFFIDAKSNLHSFVILTILGEVENNLKWNFFVLFGLILHLNSFWTHTTKT